MGECVLRHIWDGGRGMGDGRGPFHQPPIPVSRPVWNRSIIRMRANDSGGALTEHVSPASRERVVQDLADHFAQDRLTLPEYERRVELAYRAGTADALRDLTRDLAPTPPVRVAAEAPLSTRVDSHPRLPARTRNFFALMSGVIRRGNWLVPAKK